LFRGHAEQIARNHGIALGYQFEATPLHQANRCVDDGFSGEAVLAAIFQPEDVADQVERADLAPSVRKQFVASHRTSLDLIDIIRRLPFAVDLGPFSVRKFV
jgi:hypothetical protein